MSGNSPLDGRMTEHLMTDATPLASEQITNPKADARKKMYAILRDWNVGDFASRVCSVKGHGSLASDICEAELDAFGEELLAALSASPAPSGQGVSGGGWDHRYRPLAFGEIIEAGDECRRDDGTWVTGICVGETAPDPAYTSHRVYRRLKAAPAPAPAPAPSCAPGEVDLKTVFDFRDRFHDANDHGSGASTRQWARALAAALSPQGLDAKEGGVLDNTWTPYGKRSLKNLTDLLDIAGQKPTVVSVINRAYDEIVFLRALVIPSQRLDAATAERCAQVIEDHGNTWGLSYRSMTDTLANAVRALATEPHQHGGKA